MTKLIHNIEIYAQDYEYLIKTNTNDKQPFPEILNHYIKCQTERESHILDIIEENNILRDKIVETILNEERNIKQEKTIAEVVDKLVELQNL